MTATIDTSATVGQLVAQAPSRARVFEQIGIDYCCGGKKPLEQACTEKGLDARTVAAMLDAGRDSADRYADASAMTLTELVDHIEATHHEYLRRELPRITYLLTRVVNAHGTKHPAIIDVAGVFQEFVAEIQQHMIKEEQVLFPAIRQYEQSTGPREFHCGSIAAPIRVMEAEHDSAGNALEQFRSLTENYSTPADVCNTYRALMDALLDLEKDMHQHVHKENNILFPRAIELERCSAA